MSAFFSPKGRVSVPRRLAVILNTGNILAPTLLFLAVILVATGAIGEFPPAIRQLLVQYAAVLVLLSFAIRIVWGICIHVLRRRRAKEDSP